MGQPRVDILENVLYSRSLYFLFSRKNFYSHPLKDSYIVHDHIDASFIFLIQKDFHTAGEHIGASCVFLLEKGFGTFPVLLFDALLYLSFYIQKKNVLSVFLHALQNSLYYMSDVHNTSYVNNRSYENNVSYANHMNSLNNTSYVNNWSYVNSMSYVNNMSYVK